MTDSLREECRRLGAPGASTVCLRLGGCRARDALSDGPISSSSSSSYSSSLQLSSLDRLRLPPLDAGERNDALPPDDVRSVRSG